MFGAKKVIKDTWAEAQIPLEGSGSACMNSNAWMKEARILNGTLARREEKSLKAAGIRWERESNLKWIPSNIEVRIIFGDQFRKRASNEEFYEEKSSLWGFASREGTK